jgi:GNAT superfamily N-acetyltransferase
MTADFVIRRARAEDAEAISQLIAGFADEALMLRRTPEMVELAIDDYVVGVTRRGGIVACGALKEYSPSVAEVAAIAVSRDVHGCGVGRAIVAAVETLALSAGFSMCSRSPCSRRSSRDRISARRSGALSGKIRRDCLGCASLACNEICSRKLHPRRWPPRSRITERRAAARA